MLFKLFLLSTASLGLVLAEDLQKCGDAYYLPSQYTCYDGNLLCPVISGQANLRCDSACYTPFQYSCANKTLEQLPKATGAFSAYASNPSVEAIDKKTVEACGRHFFIGQSACTYCPSPSVPWETCASFPNITLFYAGSSLDTSVPGGQQYYIETNGALGFTQAHSTSIPTGAGFGVTAIQNGLVQYPNADGWLACPVASNPAVYQVYAKLADVQFNSTCVPFYMVEKDASGNVPGAWQYT